MLQWKTILVPTDFSDGSRYALRTAAEVAHLCGATLVMLHVAELPPVLDAGTMIRPEGTGTAMSLQDFTRDQALGWMAADCEAIALDARVPVRQVVEIGPAVSTVLEVAAREGADLLVLGTHGRTGFAKLMLGSVTERIVRQASIPVLTVRYDPNAAKPAG